MTDKKPTIDMDEWYPVYSITDKGLPEDPPVDLDAATLERIERVFREFDEIQDMLRELHDKQHAAWLQRLRDKDSSS